MASELIIIATIVFIIIILFSVFAIAFRNYYYLDALHISGADIPANIIEICWIFVVNVESLFSLLQICMVEIE